MGGIKNTGTGLNRAKKILVVEDDENIRLLIIQALATGRYKVFGAADGNQALEDAGKLRPDLILLDLMLPGKDGIEVCRRLKSTPETKDIKIIILTAQKNAVVRSVGLAYGADLFLNKPFKMADLVAKVHELLG